MKKYLFVMLMLTIAAFGCRGPKTVQKTESVMGTDVTITVVARTAEEGNAAVDAAMEEVKRFDRMMSLYKDTSEITRVNMAAGKSPVAVSAEMIGVVEASNRISELSGGAFDITIGPLVVLWQMRLKEGRVPTDRELHGVRPLVNYRNIVVDKKASTLFLKKPGMIMDLGGVAKGYATDKVVDLLRKRGIDNAIVALAGDIRVIGRRADNSPWKVGVQHPREKDKVLTVLDLSDKYISTSGDYERFKVVNKKRYHHIIDPRTGRPSTGMESVTLVCDRGAVGDPLTTALFILGTEKGMEIVKELGYEALFVDDQGAMVNTKGIATPN